MIIFADKQFETKQIEIIENTYTVKVEAPKESFEMLKTEPQEVRLEDGDIAYEFSTADYSDITITEYKGVTTIVFNFVDHNTELKAQIAELQKIIQALTEVEK